MRIALSWIAIAAAAGSLGAQDATPAQSARPASGALFVRKELQLLDLRLTLPLTEGPDCGHAQGGYRGGSLSFRHDGAVTLWTVVDTILQCDASAKPYPVGVRRDSGYVMIAPDQRRVVLHTGDHSPVRVSVAQLRWLNPRRDSLVLFGSDSLRRDLYVGAPASTAIPDEQR
jgi:hypothetical protein